MRITIAAALAISVALTGGCSTYEASRRVAKAGGVTMLVGVAIVAIAVAGIAMADSNGSLSEVGGYAGVLVIVAGADGVIGGAAISGAGLIGMATHDKEAVEKEEEEAAAAAGRQRTVEAWVTTREAIAAARADDCARVQRLDRKVRILDAEVHADVFRTDPAIKRCLAP